VRLFLEGVDLHRQVTGRCLGTDAPAAGDHADRSFIDAGNHGHRGSDDLSQHDIRLVMLFEATGQLTEVFGKLVEIGGSRVGGGGLTLAAGSGVGHGSSASGVAVLAGARVRCNLKYPT
jgi:hypothetical protein